MYKYTEDCKPAECNDTEMTFDRCNESDSDRDGTKVSDRDRESDIVARCE